MSTMLSGFEKHPDVAKAAHVGDPTLVTGAGDGVGSGATDDHRGARGGASEKLGVETIRGTDVPNSRRRVRMLRWRRATRQRERLRRKLFRKLGRRARRRPPS